MPTESGQMDSALMECEKTTALTRKFLTLADDTQECYSAILFAAMRAKRVGAGLVILKVVQVSGMGHWRGLDEDMRTEAMDNALAEVKSTARMVKERVDIDAEIIIEEGKPEQAITKVTNQDSTIKVIVLGSGEGRAGPGPLVSRIGKGKSITDRHVAITIIPGGLTDAQLDEMGGANH
ncbi:universal stress protein [Hirschia maritima]|uniref:universal stress protein n=1 Tax=Hirschia maritima TaxID=1121961 RepID=UPI00037D1A4D|nr:universal stress protein [Hirschia maritima]